MILLQKVSNNDSNFPIKVQLLKSKNINPNKNLHNLNNNDNMNLTSLSLNKQKISFIKKEDNYHPNSAYGLGLCSLETEHPDIELIEQAMQIALQSENAGIRNGAQQILQDIREVKNTHPPQNNNDGCFITTAVCESFNKPDDCFELTAFRNFRDNWLMNQADGKNLISEYYNIAPRIVASINKSFEAEKIYKNIWEKYLKPCLKFIESGDNFSCKNKYIEMVRDLKRLYI